MSLLCKYSFGTNLQSRKQSSSESRREVYLPTLWSVITEAVAGATTVLFLFYSDNQVGWMECQPLSSPSDQLSRLTQSQDLVDLGYPAESFMKC